LPKPYPLVNMKSMSSREERDQAGAAIVDALAHAPSGILRTAMNAKAAQVDRESFDAECAELYASALEWMPRSIVDLEDPKRYAAWCIRSMKHARKTTTKNIMVQHIGKVFGHDKRTIEVKDQNTFRDVIRKFQAEFRQGQIVDAEVKALPADASH
jgi:hypothetical protein